METKYIEELKNLADYKWDYKNKIFDIKFHNNDLIFVNMLNHTSSTGLESPYDSILKISKKNLSELELFGLKVIIDEKPKITRKERNLLECFPLPKYFTRDKNGWLCMYANEPILHQYPDAWGGDNELNIVLSNELFKFITWESQKAWTKEELMGLEVMD